MPIRTTKFLGIDLAASVSIAAMQAGITVSIGPILWGVDPNAGGGGEPMAPNATLAITVEAMGATSVAPHAQWFTAANMAGFTPLPPGSGGNAYDPQAHDITYVWSFGDVGSVPHPQCNLPTAWRDTNIAYGKRVAHVFEGPGTYTVTCWAFDEDGHYGIATTTVTVSDPAVIFPGNRTICINPDGDASFTGAPAGAQTVNGYAALGSAIESLSAQTCRILFKRGATYIGSFGGAWNQANAYYAAYGIGAAPILRPTEGFSGEIMSIRSASLHPNIWFGLEFIGRWDVETETGDYASFVSQLFGNAPIVFHKCTMRNFGGNSMGQNGGVYSACYIANWRAFGIIPGGAHSDLHRIALIGTAIDMSPNACQGQFNSFWFTRLGNSNGPVRISNPVCTFISAVSSFSNTGWSSDLNSGQPQTERNRQAIQAPFRMGSDPQDTNVLHSNIMDRVVCEGTLGLTVDSSGASRPSNWVLDKVIVLGNSDAPGTSIGLNGGATLRNVLCWRPNVPISRTPANGFLTAGLPNANGAANRRVRVHGCTFFSAATTPNRVYAFGNAENASLRNLSLFRSDVPFGGVPWADLQQSNNIVHCPAQDAALVASAPVQLVAIPGLTTLYRGPRWNFPPIDISLGTNVAPGGTVTFNYPTDTTVHPNGRITDQAYFLTPPGNNVHMLGTSGQWAPDINLPLSTARGQFTVVFGASNITVTNTSPWTWASGVSLSLLLDRRNDIGGTLTQFASPATVEVPVPIAGSPALVAAGVVPWNSLLNAAPRPGRLATNGATVPGTAPQGALVPA